MEELTVSNTIQAIELIKKKQEMDYQGVGSRYKENYCLWVIGDRHVKTFSKLYNKSKSFITLHFFYMDNWNAFSNLLQKLTCVISKSHTLFIE